MFDKYTEWTQRPCYYAMAYHRGRQQHLAGPYPTLVEADAALPKAREWAITLSGDPEAASYRYETAYAYSGELRSILGMRGREIVAVETNLLSVKS